MIQAYEGRVALKGVHFLLTYRCDSECDHCFAWGSPKSRGVFTISGINNILLEAKKLETITNIAVEGGEPFLYYPIMLWTVRESVKRGFHVEVLSNCYWASSPEDAVEWLRPIAEAGDVKLSLSSDLYHGEEWITETARNAVKAANALGMETSIIAVKHPSTEALCPKELEGVQIGNWELMYRGRAALMLTEGAGKKPWTEFTECPYENLAEPKRVHVDPYGYMHVCQGISIGNAWQEPFSKVIQECKPFENAILEPLIHGGPAALVEKFDLPHDDRYADACHLCYVARCILRSKYPDTLAPDQMYGAIS